MPNDLGPIQDHFSQGQPNLGYGHQSEASIDAVNQWMRSTPWWQQIAGQGGHLSNQQRQMILRQAQANGVVVDEGDIEIDPAGNFNPKGHKLRNTLIVAGIAGATLATMGAAGAFGGAIGGTSAASGTAAGGMAGVGGITASPGLASLSAGSMIGGGAGAGAAGAGAAGAGGLLASSQIGSGAMGPIAGGTSGAGMMGMGAGAAAPVGQSIARHIGSAAEDVAGESFKHQLASALAGLGGAGLGHMMGGGGGSNIPPELQQLLAMSMKQQTDLDPLRQNVTQGVNAMLPTFAKGR